MLEEVDNETSKIETFWVLLVVNRAQVGYSQPEAHLRLVEILLGAFA
jgi:hypothetical protein